MCHLGLCQQLHLLGRPGFLRSSNLLLAGSSQLVYPGFMVQSESSLQNIVVAVQQLGELRWKRRNSWPSRSGIVSDF